ncbi:tyrosine-protein phosphatase [Phenylobacterium sp. LjRoot219]|uniref:tyrosine-protein phosphatase n=1 Tax=Phenylobacterium sp. LjRoot219 TaxID=3342283 RepID=UPI003ED0AB28
MTSLARRALFALAAVALAAPQAQPAAASPGEAPAPTQARPAAAAKPAAKAAPKPVAKPAAKPVAKAAPKSAAKPVAKSTRKPAAKPVAKAATAASTTPCPVDARKVVPFTAASVSSLGGDGFSITWLAPASAGPVQVSAAPRPDGTGGVRAGPATRTGALYFQPKTAAARWYFTLKPACGRSLTVAERNLHLDGAPNFRDVGGYRTDDGRWVRMGMLYRADELSHLTDKDLKVLTGVGVKTVADLRTVSERSRQPDKLPPKAVHAVYDPSEDAPIGVTQDSFEKVASGGRYDRVLPEANRRFVSDPGASAAFRKLMGQFATGENPTVFHCTAGKDRTGWAAAVLLTALGVPRETVMADYMLSADNLAEKNRVALSMMQRTPGFERARPEQLESLLTVRRAYLQAGFDQVEKEYGSFDAYLHEGLGLTDAELEALRARYLVGAAD